MLTGSETECGAGAEGEDGCAPDEECEEDDAHFSIADVKEEEENQEKEILSDHLE